MSEVAECTSLPFPPLTLLSTDLLSSMCGVLGHRSSMKASFQTLKFFKPLSLPFGWLKTGGKKKKK